MKFSIIIPTRNRQKLLIKLLSHLDDILTRNSEIIVIDSSDVAMNSFPTFSNFKFRYIHTDIKSAAIQRNIGLDHIDRTSDVTFFLDDDTFPNAEYFNQISDAIMKHGAIGASGLALNPKSKILRCKPKGLKGLVYRLFLLDSKKDGKLLKSAINIPCRDYFGEPIKSDWLIGCSGWKTSAIEETKFENDFYGASLAEDVIFSIRMKKKGTLIVDPKIFLDHFEEIQGRPNEEEFWKMWIVNRFRIMKVLNAKKFDYLFFWWASFGQLILLSVSSLTHQKSTKKSIKGIYLGAKELVWKNHEN